MGFRYTDEEEAPAEQENVEEPGEPVEEPETARLLDETERYVAQHLVGDKHATRVSALFATATHGMPLAFVTFPHLLFASRLPGLDGMKSGKTTGMNVTAALSANPRNAKGTYAALRAKLVAASVQTANPARTFYHDQVDNVFGLSGQNRGGNPVLTSFLQEGYKAGATDSISRQGVDFEFSLFHPIVMTTNATGLPVDILGRCITVYMDKGVPSRYFSVRESEAEAKSLSAALDVAVKGHIKELTEFRARGIHDKLTQRLLEVWEPLFAVASVLGGQRWLNWCLEAFAAIGLESEQSALSPAQQVLRDCSELLGKVSVELPNGRQFAEGMALADELKRTFKDDDIYSTKTPQGLARMIAESMPIAPKQIRIGRDRINGYYADDIRRTWEQVRPPELADAQVQEEENPFAVSAVSDEDFDEVFEIDSKPAPVSRSAVSLKKKEGEK